MEHWKRNFVLVWTNNFITAIGMMAFLPLFPLYLRDLGVEDPSSVRLWSGLCVGAAPLTAALMGPLWGSLGDRIGRKLMLLRANLAIVVFVGLMGLVRSPQELLLLRLGQGVFSGFLAPSLTLVSVATPADRQGRVMSLLHTAMLAGGVAGPLIGGAISDEVGMRAVFPITAGLSLFAAIVTGLFVREADRPRRGGEIGRSALALLRATATDLVSFTRAGPFRAVIAAVFVVRFGAALFDPILELYVETLGGYEPGRVATTTGIVFGISTMATLVFTPLWGRVGDRQGASKLLLVCATGAGMTYLPQALVHDVWTLSALRFLSGAFVAGIFPAAYTMTARSSAKETRGSAYGVTFSSLILANALGPAAGGGLAAWIGLRPLIVCASALMLGAAGRLALMGVRAADDPSAEPTEPSSLA